MAKKCFKTYFLKIFSKRFRECIRMENSDNKNKNIETKYLKHMRKNRFLKVKNSLVELVKDFIELKNKEVKIKSETEELFKVIFLKQLLCL